MSQSQTETSKKKYWIQSAIWLVICIGFLVVWPEWFWVTLPFLFTNMVYAFGRI